MRQVGQIEIGQPAEGQCQTDEGGAGGHIGLFVEAIERLRLRSFATGCHRVHTAAASQHQAVYGAKAGDGDKQLQHVAQSAAEDVGEGDGGALVDEVLVGGAACYTNVVEDVGGGDDDTADNQGAGEVLFGILNLCVDGGGDDPALIGKSGGTDGGKQRVGGGGGHGGGGAEILGQGAVY